ncbi:hypothetical protein LT679_16100 [Mucilaginibacter roseus]|uniref:Uncharacterized protein n=1 Tax=Mucilaginibacter roseus TaxID=1528868 RepID=A0ABS8U856_9SPHI|nr:hypothetical protein [Mucilaginibacter roseus]MCD8742134.1 hypothetical protein [Mucilaginibacter roseus]
MKKTDLLLLLLIFTLIATAVWAKINHVDYANNMIDFSMIGSLLILLTFIVRAVSHMLKAK